MGHEHHPNMGVFWNSKAPLGDDNNNKQEQSTTKNNQQQQTSNKKEKQTTIIDELEEHSGTSNLQCVELMTELEALRLAHAFT